MEWKKGIGKQQHPKGIKVQVACKYYGAGLFEVLCDWRNTEKEADWTGSASSPSCSRSRFLQLTMSLRHPQNKNFPLKAMPVDAPVALACAFAPSLLLTRPVPCAALNAF
jgi:hypothetical protein